MHTANGLGDGEDADGVVEWSGCWSGFADWAYPTTALFLILNRPCRPARWPRPITPATFAVKGFHFKYDDVKLDPKVAGWNVTVLPVRDYDPSTSPENALD